MSAMPMGAPGWPEFACCTASMASARIAFAIRESLAIGGSSGGGIRGNPRFYRAGRRSAGAGEPRHRWPTMLGMKGLHLTADLYRCRCDAAWLTDAQKLGP